MSVSLRTTPDFDVVAIVASAGGLRALIAILARLPADFPAGIVVLQHRAATGIDYVPRILAAKTCLPVATAANGRRIEAGSVIVAPPGRQLEMQAHGRICLDRTDRVDFHCPSGDVLLASIAGYYRERAVACILTGNGRDGAKGVRAIREAGGFVLVQSPADAEYPDMPMSAIETRKADLIQPLDRLAYAINTIVQGSALAA